MPGPRHYPVIEGGPGPLPPPTPTPTPKQGTPGANPSLVTSTGGLFGFNNILLVPFYDIRLNRTYFIMYDPSNFNCEDDCVYNFRLEEVVAGREIDVHKVYLQYKDLGKVTFKVIVSATQYNKALKKETINSKTVVVTVGKGDGKIHSYFVDLKVVGERPQISIFRKGNAGPLSIVKVMLCGHSDEGEQL